MDDGKPDGVSVIVELVPRPGLDQISLSSLSRDEAADRSDRALGSAMAAIQDMARRLTAAAGGLDEGERPKEIEVEFGIRLDTDGGAVISRVQGDSAIRVRLLMSR